MGQARGIKALLLDQKAVLCGIGNWVADEVLYQSNIHPNQNYLTSKEVSTLQQSIPTILQTAVDCLIIHKTDYPSDWLFHQRWNKNQKKTTQKDCKGRVIEFIQAG